MQIEVQPQLKRCAIRAQNNAKFEVSVEMVYNNVQKSRMNQER